MTELPPLRNNWEIRECKDYPGRCYYYNSNTQESTWIRPGTLEPKQIYVSQILLKTKDSINPITRNGPATRTTEEATERMENIRQTILSQSHDKTIFQKLANEESDLDDNTSGGILGWIRKSDVPQEFSLSAWRLKPGEISEVVISPLGVHLIYRMQ